MNNAIFVCRYMNGMDVNIPEHDPRLFTVTAEGVSHPVAPSEASATVGADISVSASAESLAIHDVETADVEHDPQSVTFTKAIGVVGIPQVQHMHMMKLLGWET